MIIKESYSISISVRINLGNMSIIGGTFSVFASLNNTQVVRDVIILDKILVPCMPSGRPNSVPQTSSHAYLVKSVDNDETFLVNPWEIRVCNSKLP